MFRNYFKVVVRNLVKNKLYSCINIGGLSISICVCMLIMLYVAHELSYDRFHKNADRIFSVYSKIKIGSEDIQMNEMSYVTGPLVKQSDPTVESFLRINQSYKGVVVANPAAPQMKFPEDKFLFADNNFFSFFSFKLLEGDAAQVLKNPNSLVISEQAAHKYFGNIDPIGKILKYNNDYPFTITGIADDPPSNSSIQFDFVASLSTLPSIKEKQGILQSQQVAPGSFTTYFLLRSPAAASNVVHTLQALSTTHQKNKSGITNNAAFHLIALPDIHLDMNFGDTSNIRYLKIFPLVAALILFLALINYMSLATARATLRTKEIGVRKVMGANRRKIALQFYMESTLFAVLSFLIGSALFFLSMPFFFHLLQLKINHAFLFNPLVIGIFSALLIITILLAGSYPSLVLSAYNPISVLCGKMSRQRSGNSIRKIFTLLQFTISVALIICGIIIDRQLYYFRHTDTGVTRENILMIPFHQTIRDHYQPFRKDVAALAGIRGIATAHYPMYEGYDIFVVNDKGKNIPLFVLSVDENFIPLLGLQWKVPPADPSALTESGHIVINEAAIKQLGLGANPSGGQINRGGRKKMTVAGVLKNFNYESLQNNIGALGIFIGKDTASAWGTAMNGCLFAKVKPHVNLPTLIASIKKIYDGYDKETPFNYQFMDDAFNAMYKAEDRLAKIFSAFTLLTIFIACMGLFGLAAFASEQRTKEIGIRKVLGASVKSIVNLLAKDFILLVLIAVLIASPIGWWAMNKWLQNFAYHIHISWWIFAGAGALAIIVALVTVSFQAIRAAVANPVEALRSE